MSEENKCKHCGKEFSSKEALDMHIKSKHFHQSNPKLNMDKKKIKNYIILTGIIILIIGAAYYLTLPKTNNNYDNLAKCLSEKNVTMYGACWCPHCKDQKKEFGSSFQYINYIECQVIENNQCVADGRQTEICKNAEINGYPAWIFNDGTRKEGFVTLKDLAAAANCSIGV
jgi:hypothetical protein